MVGAKLLRVEDNLLKISFDCTIQLKYSSVVVLIRICVGLLHAKIAFSKI